MGIKTIPQKITFSVYLVDHYDVKSCRNQHSNPSVVLVWSAWLGNLSFLQICTRSAVGGIFPRLPKMVWSLIDFINGKWIPRKSAINLQYIFVSKLWNIISDKTTKVFLPPTKWNLSSAISVSSTHWVYASISKPKRDSVNQAKSSSLPFARHFVFFVMQSMWPSWEWEASQESAEHTEMFFRTFHFSFHKVDSTSTFKKITFKSIFFSWRTSAKRFLQTCSHLFSRSGPAQHLLSSGSQLCRR